MATDFWESQSVLFIDILIEQPTINEAYYLKLLKDRIKQVFRSERRVQPLKSVCLLYENATTTIETLERTQWEALPHPTYIFDLMPSDFHLFDQ
jgi:hypothetical protein